MQIKNGKIYLDETIGSFSVAVDGVYIRFAENLMIFSRQDECEHLIRAKFNGLVK